MLAREAGRKYVLGHDDELADTITEQLRAAGYRLLAPGELDAATIEACVDAVNAEKSAPSLARNRMVTALRNLGASNG
jgi:hypothetical protein